MIALLLAAAGLPSAIDAERAFARDAQVKGQWTAFRAWSANDAIMFTPQPVNAHDFLKGRKDPPRALKWSPSRSLISCDGDTAINDGPWRSANGKQNGYFTTVWRRGKNGWRWVYDGGDVLAKPRPATNTPAVRRASCDRPVGALPFPATDAMIPTGSGISRDSTLAWWWSVDPKGARIFRAYRWNGRSYDLAIDQKIAAE